VPCFNSHIVRLMLAGLGDHAGCGLLDFRVTSSIDCVFFSVLIVKRTFGK